MTDSTATIQGLRDRLTGLLADWGSELAAVLKELEEKRARVAELEGGATGRGGEIEQLKQRVEGQNSLIDALRGDAEEAQKLRAEVRTKDLEFERVSSELESKKELVRALRRDTDGNDRVKAESSKKDREIEDLKNRLQRAERQANDAAEELTALRETAAGKATDEQAEIEALRAELDARKTVIKSLRSDQERIAALQASLDEKRGIVEQLETTIGRHSNTIAELRRSVDTWKRKYQAVRGDSPTATTSVNLPVLSDTDVRVIEQVDKKVGGVNQQATIAIDMRRSLLEARRTAGKPGGEK
jgi:chromosome segregation ATPase